MNRPHLVPRPHRLRRTSDSGDENGRTLASFGLVTQSFQRLSRKLGELGKVSLLFESFVTAMDFSLFLSGRTV